MTYDKETRKELMEEERMEDIKAEIKEREQELRLNLSFGVVG